MITTELQDRASLRELVDTVSILGDKKDYNAQVKLFTEDALSETFSGGAPILKLKGREAMAEAFTGFLRDFETVYHFNGQQVVSIEGDKATGTCYCLVTLIANQNGKQMQTTIGAIYQDDYVRRDNCWLIAKRKGTFEWQVKSEVSE